MFFIVCILVLCVILLVVGEIGKLKDESVFDFFIDR